jgi:hypothetical protein
MTNLLTGIRVKILSPENFAPHNAFSIYSKLNHSFLNNKANPPKRRDLSKISATEFLIKNKKVHLLKNSILYTMLNVNWENSNSRMCNKKNLILCLAASENRILY